MNTDTPDGLTEQEREAVDRASSVLGWQHLARYSGMSREWLDRTLAAIVRSALAACVAAERERAEARAAALLCERHQSSSPTRQPCVACVQDTRAALGDTPPGGAA